MQSIECQRGRSADKEVLLGFAPARTLKALSWADVLDEEAGRGYQRRFNPSHSMDFRRYIHEAGSSTPPLTFNLRPRSDGAWRVVGLDGRSATLELAEGGALRPLSQVDCQHRLGHLADSDVELPFMCFVGLEPDEEMQVFLTINGKAKGLSRSLLDYQEAKMCNDVARDRPELFIALCLANDPSSPWHRSLDFGGESTSGLARRASLRTMQKGVRRFLNRSLILSRVDPETVARIVLDYWMAVSTVLQEEWARPRRHLVTKGVGVYALMDIAADLVAEAGPAARRDFFADALSEFAKSFDWSTGGPLAGLGGEKGASLAAAVLRDARRRAKLKAVANG